MFGAIKAREDALRRLLKLHGVSLAEDQPIPDTHVERYKLHGLEDLERSAKEREYLLRELLSAEGRSIGDRELIPEKELTDNLSIGLSDHLIRKKIDHLRLSRQVQQNKNDIANLKSNLGCAAGLAAFVGLVLLIGLISQCVGI